MIKKVGGLSAKTIPKYTVSNNKAQFLEVTIWDCFALKSLQK